MFIALPVTPDMNSADPMSGGDLVARPGKAAEIRNAIRSTFEAECRRAIPATLLTIAYSTDVG